MTWWRVLAVWAGSSVPSGVLLALFLHQGGAGREPRPIAAHH
ncbi:MAG: hypothetical protein ACRDYW_07660 [Acidimicrobiales bacterium]